MRAHKKIGCFVRLIICIYCDEGFSAMINLFVLVMLGNEKPQREIDMKS